MGKKSLHSEKQRGNNVSFSVNSSNVMLSPAHELIPDWFLPPDGSWLLERSLTYMHIST